MGKRIKAPEKDCKRAEINKLENTIGRSLDKLIKTKLEVFAQTVLVNMPNFKKKKDEEIAKSLERIAQHIYDM